MRLKIVLSIMILILSCATAISIFSATEQKTTIPRYIIVIDAGSSGTRLHLFQYRYELNTRNSLQSIYEVKQVREPGGLGEVAADKDKLQPYFMQLFSHMNGSLTSAEKQQTPIYLMGTAGFRILDKTQQVIRLNDIREALSYVTKVKGYMQPVHAHIIYGRTEALFAWLTINELSHHLNFDQSTLHSSLGVLDMGGASTQIIFLPDSLPQSDYASFVLNQHLILPYAKSYLGFGMNQAEISLRKVYGDKLNVCYPKTGHANFSACLSLMQQWLSHIKHIQACKRQNGKVNCNALGFYQPPIMNTNFIGISNYASVFHVFNLDNRAITLILLKNKIETFCNTPWSSLTMQYGARVNHKMLAKSCLQATWIYTLLNNFGMQAQTSIMASDDIHGESTDWPLGAAIYLLTQPLSPIPLYSH